MGNEAAVGHVMYIDGNKLMRSDGKEYDYDAVCLSRAVLFHNQSDPHTRCECYAVLCRSEYDGYFIAVFCDRTRVVVDTTAYIRHKDIENVSYISCWCNGKINTVFRLVVSYTNGLILYLSFRANFSPLRLITSEEASRMTHEDANLLKDEHVGTHDPVLGRYYTPFYGKDVKFMTGNTNHVIKSDYTFTLNLTTNIITRDDSIDIPPESLRMIDVMSYRIINWGLGVAGYLALSREGKLSIIMTQNQVGNFLKGISFDDVLDYSELMCESDGKFSIIILDRNYTLSRHDVNIKRNKVDNINVTELSKDARNIKFSFCYLNTDNPSKNART